MGVAHKYDQNNCNLPFIQGFIKSWRFPVVSKADVGEQMLSTFTGKDTEAQVQWFASESAVETVV